MIPDKVTPTDKLLAIFNSKLNASNKEKMSTIFKDIIDKKLLNDLSKVMTDASICGLGQAASNPVNSVIKYIQSDIN